MKKIISIETKLYSKFFTEIFNKYKTNLMININGKIYRETDIDFIKKDWLNNKRIKNTDDFLLTQNNEEIIGFHDGPDELWMNYSEINFVKQLFEKNIIRYKILDLGSNKESLLIKILLLIKDFIKVIIRFIKNIIIGN